VDATHDLPDNVRDYLGALLDVTRTSLDVDAIYVTGSIALGDFQLPTSDVDLMVITEGPTPRGGLQGLATAIGAVPIPVRGLEFVVYSLEAVARPDPTPRWELNLNVGPRLAEPHVGFDPLAEPRHWFVLDLALARQSGIALLGPPARDVITDLPRAWLVEAISESIRWHAAEDTATPNRVLNLCRAWRWADDGTLTSKTVAAEWAFSRTGDPVIHEALRVRATGDGSLDPHEVDGFVARTLETVEGALAL